MKKLFLLILIFLLSGVSLATCNAQDNEQAVIHDFLLSTPDTYGWEATADDISFDFFPDGRLHIQGTDGEATMWTGAWKLYGNKLILDRVDLGMKETVTVKIDGEKLILGDKIYTR